MARFQALASLIAMSILLTGCTGESEERAGAPTASTPAPAAPAGPPAATDVTTLDGVQFASLTGTAAAGKLAFAQCRTCHVTDPGVNRIGPSLAGIVGRAAGTVPAFAYSPANAGSDIIWTKEKLFQYLENPQRVLPGTKMIYSGLNDAQRRADLIAYLENPS